MATVLDAIQSRPTSMLWPMASGWCAVLFRHDMVYFSLGKAIMYVVHNHCVSRTCSVLRSNSPGFVQRTLRSFSF